MTSVSTVYSEKMLLAILPKRKNTLANLNPWLC